MDFHSFICWGWIEGPPVKPCWKGGWSCPALPLWRAWVWASPDIGGEDIPSSGGGLEKQLSFPFIPDLHTHKAPLPANSLKHQFYQPLLLYSIVFQLIFTIESSATKSPATWAQKLLLYEFIRSCWVWICNLRTYRPHTSFTYLHKRKESTKHVFWSFLLIILLPVIFVHLLTKKIK